MGIVAVTSTSAVGVPDNAPWVKTAISGVNEMGSNIVDPDALQFGVGIPGKLRHFERDDTINGGANSILFPQKTLALLLAFHCAAAEVNVRRSTWGSSGSHCIQCSCMRWC